MGAKNHTRQRYTPLRSSTVHTFLSCKKIGHPFLLAASLVTQHHWQKPLRDTAELGGVDRSTHQYFLVSKVVHLISLSPLTQSSICLHWLFWIYTVYLKDKGQIHTTLLGPYLLSTVFYLPNPHFSAHWLSASSGTEGCEFNVAKHETGAKDKATD